MPLVITSCNAANRFMYTTTMWKSLMLYLSADRAYWRGAELKKRLKNHPKNQKVQKIFSGHLSPATNRSLVGAEKRQSCQMVIIFFSEIPQVLFF